MLQISLEGLEFAFEWLESLSMARICIWMLRIPFEWLEFAFKCLKFGLNGSNLHLNAPNSFRMVRIFIRIVPIACDIAYTNLHSNCVRTVRICIRIWIPMCRITFEWLEFTFQCVKSRSKREVIILRNGTEQFRHVILRNGTGSNAHTTAKYTCVELL